MLVGGVDAVSECQRGLVGERGGGGAYAWERRITPRRLSREERRAIVWLLFDSSGRWFRLQR